MFENFNSYDKSSFQDYDEDEKFDYIQHNLDYNYHYLSNDGGVSFEMVADKLIDERCIVVFEKMTGSYLDIFIVYANAADGNRDKTIHKHYSILDDIEETHISLLKTQILQTINVLTMTLSTDHYYLVTNVNEIDHSIFHQDPFAINITDKFIEMEGTLEAVPSIMDGKIRLGKEIGISFLSFVLLMLAIFLLFGNVENSLNVEILKERNDLKRESIQVEQLENEMKELEDKIDGKLTYYRGENE
ncbi:MAG: hypothetical protein HOG49_20015 [Candidatus Scalindua sp.]|jgi:hypothetical protein|nr:hypothetical protein [Candidatus Scalindua sp.]